MPARSVTITFFNNTGHTLTRVGDNLDHGIWSPGLECPSTILPGRTVKWESQSHGFLTGTEGSVTYSISNDIGGLDWITPPFHVWLHWDNPYLNNPFGGGNSYSQTIPPTFRLTHTGGSGDNAFARFTLNQDSWFTLQNQPPGDFGVGLMLLMTDGSVMAFENGGTRVFLLIPDSNGSYVQGSWQQVQDMQVARTSFASAVLADGRVLVMGGENVGNVITDTNASEIFDWRTNTWSPIAPPFGATGVGDAPCCVLADKRVLVGSIFSNATALFDPSTNTFSPAGTGNEKNSRTSSEETWTLLPDGSVLTVICVPPTSSAMLYLPEFDNWTLIRPTPVPLVNPASEIGPAILLNDGRLFFMGASGATAFFQPVGSTWTLGPPFPSDPTDPLLRSLQPDDAPACLLPNGKVICAAGPYSPTGANYPFPTTICVFDPVANTFTPLDVTGLSAAGFDLSLASQNYLFLLLPNGDVLLSEGDKIVAVYRPSQEGIKARPAVSSITDLSGGHAAVLRPEQTYQLTGALLNGLSQACSYGDDAQMATNYPLVRIHASDGGWYYCRTHDHSTMGVADFTEQSTRFDVPASIPGGMAELFVVANGVPSDALSVKIG